jgi:hypothetical protein
MDMDIGKIDYDERTEIDRNGGFYRYLEATFYVEGSRHTLKISMPDFQAGKARDLVQKEADKIYEAMYGKKMK